MPQIDIKLQTTADTSGFTKVQSSIDLLGKKMGSLGQALTTGLGVEAVHRAFSLVESTIKGAFDGAFALATEIHRGSQALGVSTDAYQVLGAQMRLAGGDAEQLSKAITKGNITLYEARNAGSTAAGAYRQLGLDVGALEKMAVEKRFEAIGRAVAGSKDQTAAYASASEILGARHLPVVLAALKNLAKEGYENLDAAMIKSGKIMSEDTIDRLHEAEKAIAKFKKVATIAAGEEIGSVMSRFESLSTGWAQDKAGLFAAFGKDAATLFFTPWKASADGAVDAFIARFKKPAEKEAAAPAGDGTAEKLAALTQARTDAEHNLAVAMLARKVIESDPNLSEFEKRDHIISLMEDEIRLRNILNEATAAVPISGSETEDGKQLKIDKLEAELDQLRHEHFHKQTQSDRQDKADASDEKFDRFQKDGGPGGMEIGASATRGAKDWVTSLGTQAEQVASAIQSSIGSVVSGITDGIMGWIDGTKSFAQSLASIGQSVLKTMLNTIVQMGAQWLINQMLVKTGIIGISVLQDSQRVAGVAKENAASAATLPLKTANAAASGISSFGLALVFGAVAVGLILALAGGFEDGGFTSPGGKGQVAGVVHAGEWVAPQWMVKHPGFGGIIAGLEGARNGSPGFDMGGFSSPSSAIARPGFSPSGGGQPVVNILMDPAQFARMQQEHSEHWFQEMSAQHMRRNS